MAVPTQRDPEVTRTQIATWLAKKMPDASGLELSPIDTPSQGMSNETGYLTATWTEDGRKRSEEMVLRIQPKGYQLFMDADVMVQWRMMEAIAATSDVPVPPLFFAEESDDVIGASFFLMGKVEGRSFPQLPPYHAVGWVTELSDAQREAVWNNGIDQIAKLHQIDWQGKFSFLDVPGPGELGLDRYIAYVEQWYAWAANGRQFDIGDAALAYVREHQPADPPLNVVWGDATPGNTLFRDDQSVAALLDWEMPTLGPGECDLGWWLFMDFMYSHSYGIPRLPGFPSRDATIERYTSKLGRPLCGDVVFYEAFAGLRMMAIALRSIDLQVENGILAPDTTMHTGNPAVIALAAIIGVEEPPLSAEMQAMTAAMTKGTVE
jgi:aminoglycoside phosphotransferase (APT) family kinase protein